MTGKNDGEERRNHYVEKDWYKTVVVSKFREKENRQLLHQAETLKYKICVKIKRVERPDSSTQTTKSPKNHSSGRTVRLLDRAKRIRVTEL